jgi:tRNA dimethylallyltransferase
MPQRPPIVIIAGPTGVGKTSTAIALAGPLGGEIVGADAMQVYRHMDIGTAKPTDEECALVKHHLIDVVDPDESFSAAQYRILANTVIKDLYQSGVLAFVVGGTGLYIKALTKGLFEVDEMDAFIQKRLRSEVESVGLSVLYERLQKVDRKAAAKIHPNDSYRIMRALEVFESTGIPLSDHHQGHSFSDTPYSTLKIGLSMDRKILYDQIDRRVDQMVDLGFVEEVQGLLNQGYDPNLKSMQSIGYRHVTGFLLGEVSWEETVEQLKRDTRRYAKRQLTWFRADPEIAWFEPTEIDRMQEKVKAFLGDQGERHFITKDEYRISNKE